MLVIMDISRVQRTGFLTLSSKDLLLPHHAGSLLAGLWQHKVQSQCLHYSCWIELLPVSAIQVQTSPQQLLHHQSSKSTKTIDVQSHLGNMQFQQRIVSSLTRVFLAPHSIKSATPRRSQLSPPFLFKSLPCGAK